jgi:acetyl-CoA acetyltransferase
VLCLGAGRFPNVGSGMAELLSKLISHPEYEYPYGTYIPPIFALNATRHMHEFGTTREQLAQVAVSQRAWSLLHPDALMAPQGPLTIDKVRSSRPIAYPFNLLDCSVPSEGGSAVLVVSPKLAARYAKKPCYLLGFGEKHTHSSISQAHNLTTLGSKESSEQAYRMAGVGPGDMDFAQLYDSFSINPIIYAEDLGLCPKGQGGAFFAGGRTAPGGEFPVNTYGGLMSFGHVGDASGQTMIVEAARQIMGIAGGQRQLAKADLGVVHCYGGMMAEHATLVLGSQS